MFPHDEIEVHMEDGTVEHKPRSKRVILLHLGLLEEEIGLNFGKGALSGGPLGELVQWSDLISSLYVLGHKIILSWSKKTLSTHMTTSSTALEHCHLARPADADLIYTDVHGLQQMLKMTGSLGKFRCNLRVLDNFGTEPAYNHPGYVRKHDLPKGYGQFALHTQQFMTQWPHTMDNSFVGFVVHRISADKIDAEKRVANRVLLYGKRESVLHSPEAKLILKVLREQEFEIHATLWNKQEDEEKDVISSIPDFITNHGYVNQSAFLELLRSAKAYVGLGTPPEGPAALEAVANGAIFVQPRFRPKRDVYQQQFKPTR
jgi:hypothetical protein